MLCGILINMPFDMHSISCLNINFPYPAYVVCLILAIIVELNACGGTLMKSSDAVISVVLHGPSRLQATHEILECHVTQTLKKMRTNALRDQPNQVRPSLGVLWLIA